MQMLEFKSSRIMRLVFIVLVIQNIWMEYTGKSVYPCLTFPKFKTEEYDEKNQNLIDVTYQPNDLILKLYPHDKRYYLFIQQLQNDENYRERFNQFLLQLKNR
jgi:hypothetical protein